MVKTGRITAFVSLIIAIPVAIMLQNLDQAFQFIQEFTGFISPGALAIFLLGFFWKRATANGALLAALGTFVFSAGIKFIAPNFPFMDRMAVVFFLCVAIMVIASLLDKNKKISNTIIIEKSLFKTSTGFKITAAFIVIILTVIYTMWW